MNTGLIKEEKEKQDPKIRKSNYYLNKYLKMNYKLENFTFKLFIYLISFLFITKFSFCGKLN